MSASVASILTMQVLQMYGSAILNEWNASLIREEIKDVMASELKNTVAVNTSFIHVSS